MTRATFCQNVCLTAHIPLHQNHIYADLPPTSLEQFFTVIWEAVSQDIVLILPQIKLNSKLSHRAFFQLTQTTKHETIDTS